MNMRYCTQTDTLYFEFRDAPVAETRDFDDVGNICAITVEHASGRAGIPRFSYEKIAA